MTTLGERIPFEIWGTRNFENQEAAGEYFYQRGIHSLVRPPLGDSQGSLRKQAFLVCTPENPYDSNAVAIFCGGLMVGFLPSGVAARYQPYLRKLEAMGFAPYTNAWIWAALRPGRDYDGDSCDLFPVGVVRIRIPEPDMMSPLNAFPGKASVLLPKGPVVRVSRQAESSGNTISSIFQGRDEAWAFATLHRSEDKRTTSVDVRVDGYVVGSLGKKAKAEMLPVVDFLASWGRFATVRALITPGEIDGSRLLLYCARSADLDQTWLAQIADSSRSEPTAAQIGVILFPALFNWDDAGMPPPMEDFTEELGLVAPVVLNSQLATAA